MFRLLFVHDLQRKPDVDDHVLTGLHFGGVLEADPLRDAAEVHFPHQDVVLPIQVDDFARYGETHAFILPVVRAGLSKGDGRQS